MTRKRVSDAPTPIEPNRGHSRASSERASDSASSARPQHNQPDLNLSRYFDRIERDCRAEIDRWREPGNEDRWQIERKRAFRLLKEAKRIANAIFTGGFGPNYSAQVRGRLHLLDQDWRMICRVRDSQRSITRASMPLKLVIRPKSPNWIIRGTVRGIRVEESTGTGDKRIAEEIRAKREAEILTQSVYGRRATATFAEAALSYLENGGSKRFLEPIIRLLGTTPLARIDLDTIDRAARKLYPHVSNATLNRQVYTPLSAVLKHAAKRGLCPPIIVDRPDVPKPHIRWLTPDEANCLIDACGDHLRPLVTFLTYTGARIGEALWLNWRDVDLTRRHVVFPKTKNGEARGVPLHDRVIVALANLPHREGEVFRRPDGMPYERPKRADDTSAGSRIKKAFAGACKRAGIVNFSAHGCRHTWATWHYAANRDISALMRLGGWKTVSMVMRYVHSNVDEHRHTIERLPGGNLGESIAREVKSA
jgi:integrase